MYFYCGREVNSGILNVIMVGLCQVFVWDIINNKLFFKIIKNLKLELRLSGVGKYLSKLCTHLHGEWSDLWICYLFINEEGTCKRTH